MNHEVWTSQEGAVRLSKVAFGNQVCAKLNSSKDIFMFFLASSNQLLFSDTPLITDT